MEITIPYNFIPRKYQIDLLKSLDNGKKRAIICWHRRSGKDKVCWNYLIRKAVEDVGTYYYFLPTYTQAKKVIWDNIDNDGFRMLDHVPEQIIKKKNDSELKIELKNGSIIQLIAANEFEKSAVGTNPKGVVFSEYSVTDPTAWDYVRPILLANKGWAIFNFTMRGANHAYRLLNIGKENGWFTQILTIEDTGFISAEEVEQEIKEGMPRALAEQEYYCKVIEGAFSFFRGIEQAIDREPFRADLERKYQLGVDLAKVNDYTVITPFDLTKFRVGTPERFNQIDYTLQKTKIELMWHKYAKAKIWMDRTGVGSPIFDDIKDKMKNVYPFDFTEKSRKDLLTNLQILIEQQTIKIPNYEPLITELKSFRYELTESGRIKITVPDGQHDDCVMSLALSVWEIPANPVSIKSIYARNIIKEFDANQQTKKLTGSRYLKYVR